MSYLFKFLILLLLSASASSCRSTKKIQSAIATRDSTAAPEKKVDSSSFFAATYEGILNTHIDFTTFSAKVKVDFQGSNGKKSDFNAFFRLYKDSVLWVSINALLGIEAFRVLITKDSVKVMNKLDKIVQLRSVNYLQEITKIPFSFIELQDLLIGNPIYFDSSIAFIKKDGNDYSVMSIGKLFKHLLTVNADNYLVQHSKLDDINTQRARTADITYGDYENKNKMNFSTFRKITVSEKSKLDVELKYRQFEFNEALNFPFNIPKNYKLQ